MSDELEPFPPTLAPSSIPTWTDLQSLSDAQVRWAIQHTAEGGNYHATSTFWYAELERRTRERLDGRIAAATEALARQSDAADRTNRLLKWLAVVATVATVLQAAAAVAALYGVDLDL